MSNTKFTPGPWEAMGNGIWSVDTHQSIAFVTVQKPDLSEGSEAIATTKLIAAAPELLQALIDVMKQENGHGKISFDKDGRIASEIKAAVKKATS